MPPADTPAGSAVPRRVLGQYLRELRQQAGLTVKQAASLMEWSEPKLWRIETGQTALRILDVQAMCAVYGAAPGLSPGTGRAGRADPGGGWWRAYGGGVPDDFGIYAVLEDAACGLVGYAPCQVPGLLRTESMPRALIPAPARAARRPTGWSMTAWPAGCC